MSWSSGALGRFFVPNVVRSDVVQWGHASVLSGYPGATRTLKRIQTRFWWHGMQSNVRDFVSDGFVCAQPKTRPQDLLHLLHIPKRPCSHISLNFFTGLPKSQGNTVILVVVDRFSKELRSDLG